MDWILFGFYCICAYCLIFVVLLYLCLKKLKSKIFGEIDVEIDPNRLEEAKQNAEERKDIDCPICLEAMAGKKVVALCSHEVCSSCIVETIERNRGRQIDCCMCR